VTINASGSEHGIASASFTWTVTASPNSGPTGPVRLKLDGKCLDDTGNSSANGTKIQIWTCNGGAAQQWTVQGSNDSLGVEMGHGSLCATPTSTTAADGSQLVLGACGTDESAWHAL
jgi:glucosylceramidase